MNFASQRTKDGKNNLWYLSQGKNAYAIEHAINWLGSFLKQNQIVIDKKIEWATDSYLDLDICHIFF